MSGGGLDGADAAGDRGAFALLRFGSAAARDADGAPLCGCGALLPLRLPLAGIGPHRRPGAAHAALDDTAVAQCDVGQIGQQPGTGMADHPVAVGRGDELGARGGGSVRAESAFRLG
jgi:hypothetical protein